MKIIFRSFSLSLCLMLCLMTIVGCSKDNDVTAESGQGLADSGNPATPQPQKGTATRPVEWLSWQEKLSSPVYQVSSMSIVCDADGIEFAADSLDLVGAFINNECRGCSKAFVQSDGSILFMFTVNLTQTEGDDGDIPSVTLKYYSQNGTKIYSTDAFRYQGDAKWGTINEPYHFTWKAE